MAKIQVFLTVVLLQLFLPSASVAQQQSPGLQGPSWLSIDAYFQMKCPELERERQLLRTELVQMQHPARIDDPNWNQVSNRYGIVNQLLNKNCRQLSLEDQKYPEPPTVALMPEKQQVDVAMRAIRNRRIRAGESLLLQGSLAGYADAQFNLGMIYYLQKRTDASERWLRSAAQQGHQEAARMLDSIRSGGKK